MTSVDFDFVQLAFFALLSLMLLIGVPNLLEVPLLPKFIEEFQLYGKLMHGSKTLRLTELLLVPKRWFTHFYVLGTACSVCVTYMIMKSFMCAAATPSYFQRYLTATTTINQNPSANTAVHLMALLFFTLHVSRRLGECMFVSKFSDAKMNVVHYIVGLIHYWGCITALAANFPNSIHSGLWTHPVSYQVSTLQVLGIMCFLWASIHQHQAHKILANLRDGKNSNIYRIPRGDWFEYVSCPNYLAEILIYLSLLCLLDFSPVWLLITCWVVANQTISAVMSHRWYRKKFDDYPRNRCALLPYVL